MRGLGGLLAFTAVVAVTAPALADCPPLGTSAKAMERFAAALRERSSPSPSEIRELLRRERVSPLLVSPTTGPAPLEVRVGWFLSPVGLVDKVEVTPNGGPPLPWAATPDGRRAFTYERPGHYELIVWLHEPTGQVTRHATSITVSTRADFDAELRGRWSTLKARLAAADLGGALECLHSEVRNRYEPSLKAHFADRRTPVDDALTSIRLVEMLPAGAMYEMTRTGPRGALSFPVRFEVDLDGVWRLRSF